MIEAFIRGDGRPSRDLLAACVGGSAGGLDAYTWLLRHLPADMGVAIVIVNHLRTVATLLHEILPRYTVMPVELITERLLIQPNRVFIIPERRDLHVLDGEFRLKPISKAQGPPDVITVFLRSLTQHWGDKLIFCRRNCELLTAAICGSRHPAPNGPL
jgi:chemotaxis response regulator CheB